MNENVSLGRIAGIDVGFNWSLVGVVTLIAWSLATSLLPSAAPGQSSGVYWAAGVISAFVFLASLLAHELAHSVVAKRRGVKVQGITLWLFGGVTRFSSDTNSPGTQALFTFVGPLTSLVLGAISLSYQSQQVVAHIQAFWLRLCRGWATGKNSTRGGDR